MPAEAGIQSREPEVRIAKLMRDAPSYRPTGPRYARLEDKLRPVSTAGMDPDLRRGDEKEDTASFKTTALGAKGPRSFAG